MNGGIYATAALLASTSARLRAPGDRGIFTGTVKDAPGVAARPLQVLSGTPEQHLMPARVGRNMLLHSARAVL